MSAQQPATPGELYRALARRMALAVLVLSPVAAGATYLLDTRRTEQQALDAATLAARHFAQTAAEMLRTPDAGKAHADLERLLDRERFVGVRVFGPSGSLIFEAWGDDLRGDLIQAARAFRHDWPAPGAHHRNRLHLGDEEVIQVVLPLNGSPDGRPRGYLEGLYRLDREVLALQAEQVRASALTATGTVVLTSLLLFPLMLSLLRRSSALSRHLLKANLSLIRALGNAIAERDSGTDAHNYRVTLYAVALAEALGMPAADIRDLVAGAFLHDVGKIGIPDRILLKAGRLTEDEFAIMKTHPVRGLDIVAGNAWLKEAAGVIRHHHEHFDGSGYPDGLRGEAIPWAARIFAVVDVFDALCSARPYKPAEPLASVLAQLDAQAGSHFDPRVVAAFVRIAPRLHEAIGLASGDALRQRLREVLVRYFPLDGSL